MKPFRYVPWGFKLNLMYASIPPRYYRNLHNYHEYNAPRIDIGMLTASLYERSVYGSQSQGPTIAHDFFNNRKKEVETLVTNSLMDVGAISSKEELVFPDNGFAFVPPDRRIPLAENQKVPGKKQVLFVYYGGSDSTGSPTMKGYPFLRVNTAQLVPTQDDSSKAQWAYHEIQIGRGAPEHMNRRFLAGPMFIAYFGDEYTSLDFNDYISEHPLFDKHSSYYQTGDHLKAGFEELIARETVQPPDEYGGSIISWDGKPVHRSIVASQTYYDWDDDLQSAHTNALLAARCKALEERIRQLEG